MKSNFLVIIILLSKIFYSPEVFSEELYKVSYAERLSPIKVRAVNNAEGKREVEWITTSEDNCIQEQIREIQLFNRSYKSILDETIKKLKLNGISITFATHADDVKADNSDIKIADGRLNFNLPYNSSKGCSIAKNEKIKSMLSSLLAEIERPTKELKESLNSLSSPVLPKVKAQQNLAISDCKIAKEIQSTTAEKTTVLGGAFQK
jgi:hypothetical protein